MFKIGGVIECVGWSRLNQEYDYIKFVEFLDWMNECSLRR